MITNLPSKQKYAIQVDNLLLNFFVDTTVNVSNIRLTASLHRHSYAEIFACKSGEILIQTENRTSVLFPGDIAIAPSGIMHLRTPNAGSESEWISMGFSCSECASQSTQDIYTKVSLLAEQKEIVVYQKQTALYDILRGIRDGVAPDHRLSLLIDFVSLLTRLSSAIPLQEQTAKSNKKSKSKDLDRLLKLDYFINHEFMNPLTNEKIASELHIGERQLSRLVLTHYGTTLHTLLLNKRISVAAKLLLESSDTIENIALSVGFNSKMNFYREFKKAYHMTPAQYRSVSSQKPK